MENQTLNTQNKKGFTYKLSFIGEQFVTFSSFPHKKVMDVGAAFGVATLPILEKGAKVIAVDIEKTHLESIEEKAQSKGLSDNLQTICQKIQDIVIPDNSLDAIYISQVLPFLTGQEIEDTITKIKKWLKPQGKLFIVSFTPYIEHSISYAPVFEEKRKNKEKWPGYIKDLKKYSTGNPIANHLPPSIHHIDEKDLAMALFNHNFMIEHLSYFGDEANDLPYGIKYDGRERIGVVAKRL